MSDRRHQRNGRSDWNKRFQTTCQNIYGFWTYFKMDLTTNKTKIISEGSAELEIKNSVYPMAKVQANLELVGEMLNFKPLEILKTGEKVETEKGIYWAEFTPPIRQQGAAFEMKAAA